MPATLFFAGAFLCNSIRHVAADLRGKIFPRRSQNSGARPFITLVNFRWGAFNRSLAFLLANHRSTSTSTLTLPRSSPAPPALGSIWRGTLAKFVRLNDSKRPFLRGAHGGRRHDPAHFNDTSNRLVVMGHFPPKGSTSVQEFPCRRPQIGRS